MSALTILVTYTRLRRVLALDFQAGFPAGAVVLFIHWRWQPTGACPLWEGGLNRSTQHFIVEG
jgi:hypothetical protein